MSDVCCHYNSRNSLEFRIEGMSVEVTTTLHVSVCQEFKALLKMSIVKSTEMNYMYGFFFLEHVKTKIQFYAVYQMTRICS